MSREKANQSAFYVASCVEIAPGELSKRPGQGESGVHPAPSLLKPTGVFWRMTMKRTTNLMAVAVVGTAALFGAGSRLAPATAAAADLDKVPMTLIGCVVAGEAKDSFLLTHVTVDGPVPSNVFYRFDTTEGLKKQIGHRVEVQG